MMWLNPPACMGTSKPLISSCLMRDIDRPRVTQRTACHHPLLHLLWLMRLKEKMEASNVGKHREKLKCSGSSY